MNKLSSFYYWSIYFKIKMNICKMTYHNIYSIFDDFPRFFGLNYYSKLSRTPCKCRFSMVVSKSSFCHLSEPLILRSQSPIWGKNIPTIAAGTWGYPLSSTEDLGLLVIHMESPAQAESVLYIETPFTKSKRPLVWGQMSSRGLPNDTRMEEVSISSL